VALGEKRTRRNPRGEQGPETCHSSCERDGDVGQRLDAFRIENCSSHEGKDSCKDEHQRKLTRHEISNGPPPRLANEEL